MSIQKEELTVGGEKVVLDPQNLQFNETTLGVYIEKEGGFYDNFGGYLARAERILQLAEIKAEEVFSERFATFKDNGGSDKLCEAKAKSDALYISAKTDAAEAKYNVNRLKNHLRAWDKNHDNAQSLGHMLRKEMDKLNSDIKGYGYSATNHYNSSSSFYGSFDEVNAIVKPFAKEE